MNATPRGQSALSRPWQFPRPPPSHSPLRYRLYWLKKGCAMALFRTFAKFGPMS